MMKVHEQQIRTALEQGYPLAEPTSIQIHARTASWVVQVAYPDRILWLRLESIAFCPTDSVELEAQLLSRLGNARHHAVLPVQRRDGSFATVIAEQWAGYLSTSAKGAHCLNPTPVQAHHLGEALAHLHKAGDTQLAKKRLVQDKTYLADSPLDRLSAVLPSAWYDEGALRTLIEHMKSHIWGPDGRAELPSGLCHGDVHLENIMFNGTKPTLLDFGACGHGPWCYDLACYWRKRVLAKPENTAWGVEWNAVLAGYEQVRALTAWEHHAIPALATLRGLWTMAMPTLPGCERWGGSWLADHGYVQAHLKMIGQLARFVEDMPEALIAALMPPSVPP